MIFLTIYYNTYLKIMKFYFLIKYIYILLINLIKMILLLLYILNVFYILSQSTFQNMFNPYYSEQNEEFWK